MKFLCLTCICLSVAANIFGQELVYVNTENLVLRDRPEKMYKVLAILQPGCKLTLTHSDVYKKNKTVSGRFYEVRIAFTHDGERSSLHGWVDKRYVSLHPKTGDKEPNDNFVTFIPIDNNLKLFNAAKYPPPKYKGAEIQAQPFKRVYHAGPRGGRYYINARGKKVYVPKSLCK